MLEGRTKGAGDQIDSHCLYNRIPACYRNRRLALRLAMAGVDIRTIQELGGWKEIKMVEGYSHLSQQHKAEAVEKLISLAENSPAVITTPKIQSA